MSGNEQEGKGEAKMVSIPLSSDDETSLGTSGLYPNQQSYTSKAGREGGALQDDVTEEENEADEKKRLISQVLELQNTLDDLSQRVDAVKDENLKLKSENQVLGQYIENLMSASSVFQPANPDSKKRQNPSKPGGKKGDKTIY
ncbi:short coiled-coil protein B-like [Stylophora pistillata]|uniref:Short coiled-coil protein B n=1 Tax=Stylophora pistillata TaxID=50429 RepID=A0A2B4RT11_STYPI|nr:short coiled-coil protein B-like [Stylophora pistillata]PFX20741.1 Short coiled-coil protein B [Stylophora pistillata]